MKTETTIQANPKIQQSEKSQFRQYASYKPSHVEWLGDVPSHWKVDRIKDIFIDNSTNINIDVLKKVERVAHYSIPAFDNGKQPEIVNGEEIDSNKTLLIGNQILFSRLNSHKPRVWLIDEDDEFKVCSTEFFVHRNEDKKANLKFFEYLLTDDGFIALAASFQSSVTNSHKRIAPKDYYNFGVPLPPFTEQTAIAAYLDQATANIDQVIATKQKQLEKLEQYKQSKIHECVTKGLNPDVTLKPSGIDWIGDVPGHWKVERIKDVATVVLGKMLCSEDKGSYFLKPYLKSKNIGWNELLLDKVEEMWFSENELENLRVKKNDILMTEGGEVGKTSIWNDELEECYIQNSVHKITFDKKNNPRYYLYLLNHIGSFGVFTHLVSTVSIGHLTKEKLVVVKVVAPTLNEQNEIAKYLDDFCDKISKEKSIIEQQIEKLKQYRKCLIHECVTGKRKVIGE